MCCLFYFIAHSYSEEEIDIEELKKSAPKVFLDCRRFVTWEKMSLLFAFQRRRMESGSRGIK